MGKTKQSRRVFLEKCAGASVAWALAPLHAYLPAGQPVLSSDGLRNLPSNPVIIESIKLYRWQGEFFVKVRSVDGLEGHCLCSNWMESIYSIFITKTAPFFIKKDARNLEALIDEFYVYASNYKLTGLPFWICVANAEFAILDMMAKAAGKPVHALLGDPVRTQIPIYISSTTRETTPRQEVDNLKQWLQAAGAKGVKFKIGGRMGSSDKSQARTDELLKLIEKELSGKYTLYADANGSFSVPEGIAMAQRLAKMGVTIFEEPCPFDEYEMNKAVADKAPVTIAGGEQESSLARWKWLATHKGYKLLQPDLFYNGGLLRTIRVANLAKANGLNVAPHSPKSDGKAAAFLHFAAIAQNLQGLQEWRGDVQAPPTWQTCDFKLKDGHVLLPQKPGLGVEYDNEIWKTGREVNS